MIGPIQELAAIIEESDRRCIPAASKFTGSSHRVPDRWPFGIENGIQCGVAVPARDHHLVPSDREPTQFAAALLVFNAWDVAALSLDVVPLSRLPARN